MFPWNFFPFNKEMQTKMKQMKPEDINQFIQEMMGNMGNMMHPSSQNNTNPFEMMRGFNPAPMANEPRSTSQNHSDLKYTVYETHDYVFVRIQINSEEWLKQLKLYHTSHLLITENIPEDGVKNTIPLPALVRKKGTSAKYKDQILEVKIPKNIDMQYSEVDVTEI